jgi:hypothetical protein
MTSCRRSVLRLKSRLKKQRQPKKLIEQIFRRELIELARLLPEPRDDADWDVNLFGEDAKLAETVPLIRFEQVEADPDGARNGLAAMLLIPGIEGRQAFLVETPVYDLKAWIGGSRARSTRLRGKPLTSFKSSAIHQASCLAV